MADQESVRITLLPITRPSSSTPTVINWRLSAIRRPNKSSCMILVLTFILTGAGGAEAARQSASRCCACAHQVQGPIGWDHGYYVGDGPYPQWRMSNGMLSGPGLREIYTGETGRPTSTNAHQ